MHEATLKLQESKLGPDHPDTLTSRNNLAVAYLAAGRTAEAIAMHEATLRLTESKLGPDHPDTLISRNNLAAAYRAAGRTAEAIALHEATLKLREAKLGPDHPDTLTSRNNLAERLPRRRPDGRGDRDARGDAQAARGEARPRPPRHAHQPQQPRRAYQSAGTLGRGRVAFTATRWRAAARLGPPDSPSWPTTSPSSE